MSRKGHVKATSSICGSEKPAPARSWGRRSRSASAKIPGAPASGGGMCPRSWSTRDGSAAHGFCSGPVKTAQESRPPRRLNHPLREVAYDHAPAWSNETGGGEADDAAARRELEDCLAALGRKPP